MTPQFLFAPGAGAPSTSRWMQGFRDRLAVLGPVHCFDYPYQRAGRRSPDRLPVLLEAHRAALQALDPSLPVVLIGKSMGGRIGCHLANTLVPGQALAVVCLGYPLLGQSGALRDEVLLAMRRPILFVQGTRDPLCPLDRLAAVRARMVAVNQLHIVDGGDHSLALPMTRLKADAQAQCAAHAAVIDRIATFVANAGSSPSV